MSDKERAAASQLCPPQQIEMPKYTYQEIDSRTYSVDYKEPHTGDRAQASEPFRSLRNLSV